MQVSVVVCTYALDLYDDLCDAIESLLAQTHDAVEIIIVVDGNNQLCSRVRETWGSYDVITVLCNDQNQGLSASRNRGIEAAEGEVVAFMDDDAVADERWIEELVKVYKSQPVEAVGGKMTPIWVADKPSFLPREFYWLIGVTHRGFPDEGPVRNTFGSNISFRADTLRELGGFATQLGRHGNKHIQGEEAELAARMRTQLKGTLYYTPSAQVGHKIFRERTRGSWLFKRAFWQGYSKWTMAQLLPDSGDDESRFLKQLMLRSLPHRVVHILQSPSHQQVYQLLTIFTLTTAVGLGYGYAILTYLLQND